MGYWLEVRNVQTRHVASLTLNNSRHVFFAYEVFMLNTNWQWRKAIASLLSAFTLLTIAGGLASCGSNTAEQEDKSGEEQINQDNNQRTNQQGNERNESRNEEQDEGDDDNDEDQDGEDNN